MARCAQRAGNGNLLSPGRGAIWQSRLSPARGQRHAAAVEVGRPASSSQRRGRASARQSSYVVDLLHCGLPTALGPVQRVRLGGHGAAGGGSGSGHTR